MLVLAGVAVGCVDGGSDDSAERGAGRDAADDTAIVAIDAADAAAPVDATDTASDTAPVADAPLDVAPDTSPHVCPVASTPQDCSPGTGTGMGDQCHDAPSCYLKTIQSAVKSILAAHPDWFDYSGPGGCPIIKNVDAFLDAVVSTVAATGLCIERDPNAPGQEVTVKRNNAFTENFALVSSAGCARYGDPIYTGFCAPAWW